MVEVKGGFFFKAVLKVAIEVVSFWEVPPKVVIEVVPLFEKKGFEQIKILEGQKKK